MSQEATLILDEMEGMAKAIRKGIRPTQLYMTNMGGRLESHLREVKLEELFQKLEKRTGEKVATEKVLKLSEANGTKEKASQAKTYEEKVVAATRFAHQKTLNDPVFEALKEVASKESLQDWEKAMGRSGTFVARRVWGIFFSDANRERWINYSGKEIWSLTGSGMPRHGSNPLPPRFQTETLRYVLDLSLQESGPYGISRPSGKRQKDG